MQRWMRAGLAAAMIAVVGPGRVAAAGGAADEAPIHTPIELWDAPVACGACSIAISGSDVIVHELTGARSGGRELGRLRAFSLRTGAQRWATPAMPAGELVVTEYAILLHDKSRYEAYDPATGDTIAARDGYVVDVNDYGTLVAGEPGAITAVDLRSGAVLWSHDDRAVTVGDVCRDIVILVGRGAPTEFDVLDQHTGELRWRSDDVFDRAAGDLTCAGWWIYTTDGERLISYDASSGFPFLTVELDGAADIEMFREMAFVSLDDGSGTVAAVDRLTGFVAWERPASELGQLVSSAARLRRDGGDLVTVHALTGAVVNRLPAPGGSRIDVVGLSDSRVTVVSGTVVAAYGLADLGMAWQLDLGTGADDVAVGDEMLVARFGPRLVAYR